MTDRRRAPRPTEHRLTVATTHEHPGGYKRIRLRCPVPGCVTGFISGSTENVDGVVALIRADHDGKATEVQTGPRRCGATTNRMFELDLVECVCQLSPGHDGDHNDAGTTWRQRPTVAERSRGA